MVALDHEDALALASLDLIVLDDRVAASVPAQSDVCLDVVEYVV